MTEAEARAKASKILETSGVGKLLDMGPWEDLVDFISAALLAASRPGEGMIRTHEGKDLRVLGTLPVTADGCVAGVGGHIWHAYWRDYPEDCGGRKLMAGEWPWWYSLVQDDFIGKLARDYHSSESAARTAAESAKGGDHAE
jgi:hypothetical protein